MTTRHEIAGPTDDVRWVVDEDGRASGPVLVWFHDAWGQVDDPPLGEVRDSARVLSVHLPGWGESHGVERFPTLQDLALGAWWLLDELGVDDMVLSGHGIGGALAMELAAQQPQRVQAVVAATPFGLVDESDPGVDFFALLPPHLMPHLYADPTGDLVARHFPPPGDAHEKGLASIRRVEVLGSASRFLFPLPDTGVDARLYRLRQMPVDLLFGGKDGLVTDGSRVRWEQELPHADVTVVEGAAHMLPYEDDAFSRRVGERLGVVAPA